MGRPSHELKPGEQEVTAATEADSATEPSRQFPGFPFYRSGPKKGQRRYPNPRKAGRIPATEEAADTAAPALSPEEQRQRRLQHLRERGLIPAEEEEQAPEEETAAAAAPTPPTTPSPPPSGSAAPGGSATETDESKDPETTKDSLPK